MSRIIGNVNIVIIIFDVNFLVNTGEFRMATMMPLRAVTALIFSQDLSECLTNAGSKTTNFPVFLNFAIHPLS